MKYLICPDWEESQNDGQWHWISATQLIRLYGVRKDECVIQKVYPGKWPASIVRDPSATYPEHLVKLWPRYDGRYREHLENLQKTHPLLRNSLNFPQGEAISHGEVSGPPHPDQAVPRV